MNVLWPDLEGKRVLLGVSGGIAAYKAAELCRMFVKCGAQVQVVMSKAAQEFIGQATFAALSGNRVATDLFDPIQESEIGHIRLADQADIYVFAPATADLLGKMAHGIANDMLGTTYLAFKGPVVIVPAMNVNMWDNPATQSNVLILRQRGHHFVGPESGEMACGHLGEGRMVDPELIIQAVAQHTSPQDLAGKRVLVTAGPTRESLDPIRFISNRSTGKMGYAIAADAAARGGDVLLVTGPTNIPRPYGVDTFAVTDADQMAQAVHASVSSRDLLVMAAAVADYRPSEAHDEKLKKDAWGENPQLELSRTEDILGTLAAARAHGAIAPLIVGFAAETTADLDAAVREKMERKDCELLVANDVRSNDAGFEVDTNRAVIFDKTGRREELPLMSKRRLAREILDRAVGQLNKRQVYP